LISIHNQVIFVLYSCTYEIKKNLGCAYSNWLDRDNYKSRHFSAFNGVLINGKFGK